MLIQLGTIAQLVDMATAAQHLSAALTLTQQPQRRTFIAEMLGFALLYVGRTDEAVTGYTQALAGRRSTPICADGLAASLINMR